jgi:poly(3-hydroxybutyrate) depolymerase
MTSKGFMKAGIVAGLAVSFHITMAQVQPAQQGAAAPPAQAGRGGGQRGPDPRAQQRTYMFEDTNEQMPYAVFVSSKVSKDKKNPLIVSLHGLGGSQNTMVGQSLGAVELAEQGGYILVTPMGYNCGGWFGVPVGAPRGGGGRGGANAANPATAPQTTTPQTTAPQTGAPNATAAGAPQRGPGGGRGLACVGGGTAVTDAAKVRELSEKDVMNVLAMMRKEFNVDERRIYLMGHSMGGAGTYFLGSKYAKEFAALAPIAPAAMSMTNDRVKILQAIKDAGVPMLVSMGDADEAVPVANVRTWVETMKELQMNYEYKEYPGVTHGPIMSASMPDIYKFFEKHSKPAR